MKRFVHLCAVALGVVLPACGSLTSKTSSSPALATLQGTLVNPNSLEVSSHDAVRVAVVWRGNGGPGQFNVAEDLPVQPVFPSAFTIALDGPPPAGAMSPFLDSSPPMPTSESVGSSGQPTGSSGPPPDGGAGGAGSGPLPVTAPPSTPTNVSPGSLYAIGTVVAYRDQNHNGKLDLVADNATAYVDEILAANQEMSIAYFQGPIPNVMPLGISLADSYGHRPKDGYNLVRISVCPYSLWGPPNSNPACPSTPSQEAGSCGQREWLGMDTQYPLTVASSPEVASLMCLNPSSGPVAMGSGIAGPYDPAVQPAQYPSPCDPNVSCASDGSDYLYDTCVTISHGLCQGTLISCTTVGYARPTPTPASWPCAK